MIQKVIVNGTEELAKFTSQLVREGVTFEAEPRIVNDVAVVSYVITFNGGF